jgi:CheY-like chemotaxis protein/HPt (histidine-containing phosphotransfer) domain-containing protein
MSGNLSGASVLIVDDNATNRKILMHQTNSWGMNSVEATSGEQTLELLRAGARQGQAYDIAILDLMMPEMDGFQLAEAIKSEPLIASVALVLLPSFGKRGDGATARRLGIAAYLQKPVRQSQLHDCLTEVMARSRGFEPIARLVTKHSMRDAQVRQEDKTFSNIRIIVAEDNSVNQKVALRQLDNFGYRAEAVRNGRELLEALETAEYDLILMDCQMPEMDGFAATAEIRRREGAARHTIIIAMTANALDGDKKKCLAAGMDDYISKPVKADVLRRLLERWTTSLATSLRAAVSDAEPLGSSPRSNVIDYAQLLSLSMIKAPGEDFVTELIDLFLKESASNLKALREAVSSSDAMEIQRLAHLLKGSSASIGAPGMAALCEDLERTEPTRDSRPFLVLLENEFELVREALKAERCETIA